VRLKCRYLKYIKHKKYKKLGILGTMYSKIVVIEKGDEGIQKMCLMKIKLEKRRQFFVEIKSKRNFIEECLEA
jgi:hypothetical protein